jgi:hypothetical protein
VDTAGERADCVASHGDDRFVIASALAAGVLGYQASSTWSLPAAVLLGLFVYLCLKLCFHAWWWLLMWPLRPIHWILTERSRWRVGALGGVFVFVWLLVCLRSWHWVFLWLLIPIPRLSDVDHK